MNTARWNGADHEAVQRLRAAVATRLREERHRRTESGQTLDPDDERALGRSLITTTLAERARFGVTIAHDPMLAEAVYADLFGLGRLQPMLADPDVTDIEVNGADEVWVTLADGSEVAGPPVADSDAALVELVRRIATYEGLSARPFDPANPWVELRLPDGSRLCALMSVVERPVVSIRCFRLRRVFLADLYRWGAFTDEVGAFLEACVASRMNLMVSGATFAGKTTLLRGLGNAIPPSERIVTAEHFRELGFKAFPDLHPNVVEMEERPPNAEGKGGMDLHALVERSRRIRKDRCIVGEVIGPEVTAMLDAMGAGEDGSLSTIHARSSAAVFRRLAAYGLRGGVPAPVTYALMDDALDFVVHMTRRVLPDGTVRRYVSSVREVVGYDGTQVISSEVFAEAAGCLQEPGAAITVDRAERLAAAGYDPATWRRRTA